MNYVGIDWAYGRAAWCALKDSGAIEGEGLIAADEDGLAGLALRLGSEVRACVEMMSGAIWVKDQLELAGWSVEVAHARKVRDIAPLACKTDKVDARVLAELCRRELVPAVWVPSLADRAIRERLRRRAHLVKSRTSARNRIFGLLTQFGLRISFTRLRRGDAIELLERRGVPAVWRDSIAEHLDQIAALDRRIDPIDRELRPIACADARAQLLSTIPGVGPLIQPHLRRRDRRALALLVGLKAGRLRGPGAADQPVGRALGDRSTLESRLEDLALGGGRGGQSGLATDQSLSRALSPPRRPARKEPGEIGARAQAADHLLAHALAKPGLSTAPISHCRGELLPLSGHLTALHGIERPRQLPATICATSAEREMSSTQRTGEQRKG
jgi:transposase